MSGMFSFLRTDTGSGRPRLAEILDLLTEGEFPVGFTAYDGSVTGRQDTPLHLDLRTRRGAAYLATAPGSLGMARAYIAGDLVVDGVHPGNPYELLRTMADELTWHRPDAATLTRVARGLGASQLIPPAPPREEALPDWRRTLEGLRHSKRRDAEAIRHHYDVSNRFYELLLGPSMAYACACYPTTDATLEQAQTHKHDLIARKLGLRPGMRLLDADAAGGMFYTRPGVRVIVVYAVRGSQPAKTEIERQGLATGPRHTETLRRPRSGDAVSRSDHWRNGTEPPLTSFTAGYDRGRLLNHHHLP
jgi:cyclopropane-fatty-acyl-phospholipid synthase